MAKKIMVAVDESKNSTRAVEYVATHMHPSASVTLFSVIPPSTSACELDSPALTPLFKEHRQAFCALEATKKDRLKAFTEKAKKLLVEGGFPSKNVAIKIRKKKVGIARDILKEAEQGKYDTLVIGRRGVSAIKQFVMGSISNKVVKFGKNVSITVVD